MLPIVALIFAAVAALWLGRRAWGRFAAVRASERRYRALAEHAPEVTIILIDRGLRFRLLAGGALARHSWIDNDLVGRRIAEVIAPDRAAGLEQLAAAALGGATVTSDWLGAGGDALYALSLGPFREHGRGITHAICVVRDVTAERAVAGELDAQRSFLAAVLGRLTDRVVACDAAGRILTFDERDGELHPALDDDVHPLEWAGSFGLMHPDGSAMGPHEAPLLRALRGEQISDVEMLVPKPDGRIALLCAGGPVTAPDGRLLGAVMTSADISGRHVTEERLRVSEERQLRVVESMTDCVFETDDQGRWTFLNQAWTLATGHPVADSLGRPATEFVHPGDRERHHRALGPLVRGEQVSAQFSHRFLTRAGAVRWVDVRVSTIAGWDGLPTGFVGVMRDITDEQRARQHAAAERAVVQLLAGAESLEAAAPPLLEALGRELGWDVAQLWQMGADERLRRTCSWTAPGAAADAFVRAGDELAFEVGDGLNGQAWIAREPLWRADLRSDPDFARRLEAAADGLCSGVVVTLRADGAPLGVVQLFSHTRRDPEPGLARAVETIGAHVGQFILRRAAELRAAEHAAYCCGSPSRATTGSS